MEIDAGRHGPLADPQRGGHQHRHAAVKYRCCELPLMQVPGGLLICCVSFQCTTIEVAVHVLLPVLLYIFSKTKTFSNFFLSY